MIPLLVPISRPVHSAVTCYDPITSANRSTCTQCCHLSWSHYYCQSLALYTALSPVMIPLPISCPLHSVVSSCRSYHFELALTKLRQLLSFATLVHKSTPTPRWGHTLRRPSLPASPFCVSCEASASPFLDPFSSRWWRHSFRRGWTTEMPLSPSFRCTCWSGFSPW